jgi:hypothetical protein
VKSALAFNKKTNITHFDSRKIRGISQLTLKDRAKTSGVPACFHAAKTSVVEVATNLDEEKLRNNKIVRFFSFLS